MLMPSAFLALAAAPTTPPVQPGRWNVTSTVVELSVPGLPGVLQRMARGHASAEHKVLTAGQGVEALLAPDPKAKCTIDGQRIADGHYAQTLSCPQKNGPPLHVARSGTYDAAGFAGQATLDGSTPNGVMHIVLDQRTTRTGA